MKGDAAAAAAIMNRRFVGNSAKSKFIARASKNVDSAVKSYDSVLTRNLFGNEFTKATKVGSIKKQLASQI